ncbi:MAG: TetR/AcrR family transcriptional regulator [Jannaschia sp.]
MSRPIAKDHDEKRGHILAVAARVFSRQGVARASMAQVATACGISKANIYHYYDSKDALLFDILDSYLSALRDRVAALPMEGLDPAAQLGAIVTEVLRAYDGMDHEHKIQTEGIALLPEAQRKVLHDYQRALVARLSDVIAAAAPEAFAGDARKLRATVMSVFGMLNWFYMWNARAGRAERDAYADLVTRLTLGGVRDA